MSASPDLRDLWNPVTELITRALGGNTHFGYWPDPATGGDVAEATDRLTGLVARQLAASPGMSLLDVGCGNGRPAGRIAGATGSHVTGVTANRAQYTAAQGHTVPGVTFRRQPSDQLRFPDGAFDGAYSIDTLLYEHDRGRVITEIARVLRPGGRLVLAEIALREPYDRDAAPVAARMATAFGLEPLPVIDDYRGYLRGAGLDLTGLDDIGSHVRPSYAAIAAALRNADGFPREASDRLAACAELVEEFGAMSQTGYLLLTAVLHPAGRGMYGRSF